MYGSNDLAIVEIGILKGIFSNPLRAELCHHLKALDNARNDLVLEAGVFALGVLPNDDDVDVVVAGGEALKVEAVDKGGVEIEVLAELDVEGVDAAADGGLEAALEADLVLADGVEDLGGDALHVAMDVVLLEVDGGVHGVHDLLDGAGDKGADSVSGNKGDGTGSAVAGARHVGDGSGRGKAGGVEEVVEDRF